MRERYEPEPELIRAARLFLRSPVLACRAPFWTAFTLKVLASALVPWIVTPSAIGSVLADRAAPLPIQS